MEGQTNNNNYNNNNNVVVHCKVFYNGQFRRFQLPDTIVQEDGSRLHSFHRLSGHIEKLLELNVPYLLKYQDSENDYVAVSSDEELSYAISLLKPGDIFRVFVTLVEDSSLTATPTIPPSNTTLPPPYPYPSPYAYGECHRGRGGRGRCLRNQEHSYHPYHPHHHPYHHHRGGHHGGDNHHHSSCGPAHPEGGVRNREDWFQFKKEKIQTKLATLQSLLTEESDNVEREKTERKIEKMKQKLERMDTKSQKKQFKQEKDRMDSGEDNSSPSWAIIKSKKQALRQAEAEGNIQLVEQLGVELKSLKLEKKQNRKEKK